MQPTRDEIQKYVASCLKIGVSIQSAVRAIHFYGWEESSKLSESLNNKNVQNYGDRFLSVLKNQSLLPQPIGKLLGIG